MFTNILSLDFFELFDLPAGFDVDLNRLQKQYTVLQQTVHPDKFANAGDQEKRLSMQQTSHINEAYQTLKDPVRRALYLLRLKGMDIDFDNETTMDMDFLMEQMALREKMADIRQQDDPLEQVDMLATDIKVRMEELTQAFADAWQQDRLDEARELVRKMQFMQKAKKSVGELSASLEDELL